MSEGLRRHRSGKCKRPLQLFDHFEQFEAERRLARSKGGNLTYQEYISRNQKTLSGACGGKKDAK